ncbi:MAG: molybdopterin molybdotransferase MoeA [Candidatus Omnitrophota bacterium]|nr:molybdopterin molybdotransferase MoeA [Candidatus Omnitrophota bacterium]
MIMISVEKALKTVLINTKTLNSETVRLVDSLNRVIAKDIYSGINVPAFDNSAMDGYAVRSRDTTNTSKDKPKVLEVIDELKAGDMPKKALKERQAIRIMTGAPIPKGADAVIMVEETRQSRHCEGEARSNPEGCEDAKHPKQSKRLLRPFGARNDTVEILKEVNFSENIRKRGEDIKRGERVLRKGALLKSAHIGILASLGISSVRVTKKPRIAFLATGDELIDLHKKITPGKLYSSNTYSLYSQIISCGGIPENLGISKDDPEELEAKIRKGLDCDMILTSGGVSVGDYDLVKLVLAKMGTDIKFWKVAMRPGKPLAFGHIRGIPVFGLPGNPVSSMVSFEVFVRPAVLKMLGQGGDHRNEIDAVLKEGICKKKGLKYFLRAITRRESGRYVTRTTGPQGSGILRSMALANSLIILPEDVESAAKGEKVKIRFLE